MRFAGSARANKVIDERSFIASMRDSLARNFFGIRFQIGTDAEQRLLAAMASLGAAPYKIGDVARAYGARDQRGISVHRESLMHKGLIWSPRRGQLDFTVPLFGEYIRENHPLAGFDD
jgi:hypothetical protein